MKNSLLILVLILFGCESNPLGMSDNWPDGDIEIVLDPRLEQDENGYYHLELSDESWQTIHRISGQVSPVDASHQLATVYWESSHYWYIGDTLGYVIANHGLSDDLIYVAYDTTYLDWFSGFEVPVVNGASYSREDGEVNTMFAPVQSMKGDTVTVYFGYHDNWTYDDTFGEFYIVLD